MTVFGHAVLFDDSENSEDTASPKTPMQWHTIPKLSGGNGRATLRRIESIRMPASDAVQEIVA